MQLSCRIYSALLCKALQAGFCHSKLHKVCLGLWHRSHLCFAAHADFSSIAKSAARWTHRGEFLGGAWKAGLSFSVYVFNKNIMKSSSRTAHLWWHSIGFTPSINLSFPVSLYQLSSSVSSWDLAALIMNKMSGPEIWLFPVASIDFKCCQRNTLILFLVYQLCTIKRQGRDKDSNATTSHFLDLEASAKQTLTAVLAMHVSSVLAFQSTNSSWASKSIYFHEVF